MSLHLTDTRIASTLLGLGWTGEVHATIHTRSGDTQVEVRFDGFSSRFPALDLRQMLQQWRSGALETADAMHVFAVGMRAQRAYDALLAAQKTGRIPGLVSRSAWYEYDASICLDLWDGARPVESCHDLALAAACGPLGVQLVRITGSHGAHVYHLAALGYQVKDSHGVLIQHRAADLLRRSPTPDDPLRLTLEVTQPLHPLVIGYDVLHARSVLKKRIEQAKASLLITAADGSTKQALIALDYASHVGDAVCRHFKAPPGSLGL